MTISRLALILLVLIVACGPKGRSNDGTDKPENLSPAGGSGSGSRFSMIDLPGRAEALDLSAPVLRTAVAALPAMAAGKIEEKEYDLTGFDVGGQFLVPSVRTRGGLCGAHVAEQVIFTTLQLMRWNEHGVVDEVQAVQLMAPLRLAKGSRYTLQIRAIAANPCDGAKIEVDFIGLANRTTDDTQDPRLPDIPDIPGSPDTPGNPGNPDSPVPLPTPDPGVSPSPPPVPTCPPDPSLTSALVMRGALSAREGCSELWRKSFDEILAADPNSCNRRAIVQSEPQSGLVKVLQKRDGMFLNVLWLHGVGGEASTVIDQQFKTGKEIVMQSGAQRCADSPQPQDTQPVIQLKGAESLLMFTADPINRCLANAGMTGVAAMMPRASWKDTGRDTFQVTYRLTGPQPFIRLQFAIAEGDLQRAMASAYAAGQAAGGSGANAGSPMPQISFFAADIHSFIDAGTSPIRPVWDGNRWTATVSDPVLIRRMLAHWRDLEVVLKAPTAPADGALDRCSMAVRMPLGELVTDPRQVSHFDDLSVPGRRPGGLGEHDLKDLQD